MAFGGLSQNNEPQPVAEINMVPLIDVMLVLLIIFIIAAPLMTHSVQIELPKASSTPTPPTEKPIINLEINADGAIRWDDQTVAPKELQQRLQQAAAGNEQPELRIHADQETPYKYVAKLMANASREGLTNIGFISEPE